VPRHAYRLLNVFALPGQRLSGNPLCVFEDGRGLADEVMQALALQFNLSETTFVLPSERATARVRIFTPAFEMPFAGHPTLGTAHVVRALGGRGDTVRLEMKAGTIPVSAAGDVWTLEANAPKHRPADGGRGELAAMLGLAPEDVAEGALRVDAGNEQLLVPLASPGAVERCRPDPALLRQHGRCDGERHLVYVFAEAGPGQVAARFFFLKRDELAEDPGTGSACANLGGWLLARGAPRPLRRSVDQGRQVGRPSRLELRLDETGRIFVSGLVIELGRGEIEL
jgi:PhzF family phenazine biosynthesis protein